MMNYYDEEITVNGASVKHLSGVKVERMPSKGSANVEESSGFASGRTRDSKGSSQTVASRDSRQHKVQYDNSTDDDGLLQDIVDRGDDDEEDSDAVNVGPSSSAKQQHFERRSAQKRSQRQSGKTRTVTLPTAKALDNDTDASETDSEEDVAPARWEGGDDISVGADDKAKRSPVVDVQLSITPEKWEKLSLPQEVKELFPFILKYTPQTIETAYRLQPFIPEYVPAVGDVDAFLKVTIPPLLHIHRASEVGEHLRKMGLHFLDEPSGAQSEPSLLNMKLRSVLTGSGGNARSTSATLVPTAKSTKDVDRWIAEVEQVHMMQLVHDAQPRKDIENLLIDWPRAYADAGGAVQEAYQRCVADHISLTEYIRALCQSFSIEGPLETQTDYILSVQTLFALYLAASQAWE